MLPLKIRLLPSHLTPFNNSFMKKNYYFLFILIVIVGAKSFAQQNNFQLQLQELDRNKAEGKATGQEQLVNPNAVSNLRVTPRDPNTKSTTCNCWIPRDTTWNICPFNGSGGSGGPGTAPEFRNDDWSTPLITLPFDLCFYGQTVNQVYINNNGNVSIGTPYSSFTSNSFPDSAYVMIAPFWGDVDTRDSTSGLVYYKLTPTYMIVQWDHVGYFNFDITDKFNTFQLIFTDGNDPILGIGNNISFCYQDMQWTTGDASSGVNGFGGLPATVGVNEGNGTDYFLFGRFDQTGNIYDGPQGANDGIDWLDNKNLVFNACTTSPNVLPSQNSLDACEVIRLCLNETLSFTVNYDSPEPGQTTSVILNQGTMTGINVISNTPGNTATINFTLTGTPSNIGIHSFQLQAQDNVIPPGITTDEFWVYVCPDSINAIHSPELMNISIFPNPVHHTLNVRGDFSSSIQCALYDITGRTLYSKNENENNFNIDVSHFPTGVYQLQLSTAHSSFNKRIIIE